ncbi:hypothetical protein Tco_1361928 [Tanacetum coccineum]
MSRENPQATNVSKEQLVPCANRLVIKKNNQRVASDSDITDTMLRFVVEILRHHKLYKAGFFNCNCNVIYLHQIVLQMSPPDPNKTYTKTPSENQILGFIKTLGYDEDPDTKMIAISKMGISHKYNSELQSAQDDQPITKLSNTVKGDYKFGMEIPDTMISDAIKKFAVNVLKKDGVPRKTRSLTIAKETIVGELANSISILEPRTQRRLAVDDPIVQSLLDLWKGSKASRLKNLKQKKQIVTGEGSSNAHNKYYANSDTDNDTILYSSCPDTSKESDNETDDADDSNMDLSNNNLDRDDDAVAITTGSSFYSINTTPMISRSKNSDGFYSQSVDPSNIDVLDSPCLLVLITEMSQSRKHDITSFIHIESCKSPTVELFEVDSGRISIRHYEY